MSDFIESPRWDGCLAYGYTSESEYRVVITRRASGVEKRNRSWLRPLIRITATLGPRHEAEIQDALNQWHAAGGMARGFRIKDVVDWKSCQTHLEYTALDQPLVAIPDSSDYQLVKRYQFGVDEDNQPVYQYRDIYKPVTGTIVLSGAGTVDYTTGIVSGSAGGTWGGEFDVPVRFDSPTFPVEIVNLRVHSVTFALQELRISGGSLGGSGTGLT
jgi:uncharacterized protein (TIGR02217 family)